MRFFIKAFWETLSTIEERYIPRTDVKLCSVWNKNLEIPTRNSRVIAPARCLISKAGTILSWGRRDRSRAVSPISQSGLSWKYQINTLDLVNLSRIVFHVLSLLTSPHLYCLSDPHQFFWSCLITRRGWLVILLIGKPQEESRHLLMVQVSQVDLVVVVDLAQPLEHGQVRGGYTD